MAFDAFLTDPLVEATQKLNHDLRAFIHDLRKSPPAELQHLTADAQAALADEQALATYVTSLMHDDLSLFPTADQPGLGTELQHILTHGQALADTLQGFINGQPSVPTLLHQLASTLSDKRHSFVDDVRAFVRDVNDTTIADPHQALVATVSLLEHKIETFALQTPPSEPDASFLRTVDGLSDTIDRLVHTELGGDAHSWPWHFGTNDFVFDRESPWRFGFDTQPVPEPDRDLLHAADALSRTIDSFI